MNCKYPLSEIILKNLRTFDFEQFSTSEFYYVEHNNYAISQIVHDNGDLISFQLLEDTQIMAGISIFIENEDISMSKWIEKDISWSFVI